MALSKCTLTWNLTDLIASGISATISLTPTAVLTDTADHVIIPAVARSKVFTGGTGSLPGIIACDNAAITPAGWAYTITVTLANGTVLLSFTAFLNFASGATQDLSTLTPVFSATTLAAYMQGLTRTAVQTANYTAAAGQLVPVDTTSGNVTVTLPSAPAAGTMLAVKQVILGTGHTVTVACAGSDVFNRSGGGTAGTLTLLAQGMLLHYNGSGIWTVLADDLPLSQLDTRYLQLANNLSDVASPAAAYQRLGGGHYSALQGWFAALASRNTANVSIAIIGDSVTEGQGASSFATRYTSVVNTALRGNGGLGFIPIQSSGENSWTWPWTLVSGSMGVNFVGPARKAADWVATASVTWIAPPGTTSVRIMYDDSSSAGAFTWKVNSGGTTTITNAGTGDGALTGLIPMNGGDVLTLAWVSGSALPEGVIHYAGDETSGITVHGCGHFGWNSGNNATGWQQAGSGLDWRPSIAALATGALGIMLGINDARPTGANYTAAQFITSMNSLIAYLRGNAALSVLPLFLIVPYQANETFTDPGGWPAYVSALYSIAAANTLTDVLDLTLRMPAATASQTWGLYNADGVHPSDQGHQMIADALCSYLSPS